MPRRSRLQLAKDDIISFFAEARQKIYYQRDLANVLRNGRMDWDLAHHTTTNEFITFLTTHTELRVCEFRSAVYGRKITRYSWGKPSVLELAMAINPQGYFCHATALTLHRLAELGHKTIYLNVEQSEKGSVTGALTQERIDRAYSGTQRQSNLVYRYGTASVVMISGKNTKRLGVQTIEGPASERVAVTNLERTLIDIVVRPAYAGGPSRVLAAYRAAKDRVSVARLVAILRALDYIYPYHQSIGFLMQKAGYPENAYGQLRELGIGYDFYLAHGMKQSTYSREWRLFYPKRLRA